MKLSAPLYMLRHGETAWNLDRRMQGSKDSSLTARGRAQATAVGRALAAELAREPGPTVFLRSPLGRTCETALIVGRELGLDPAEWRDDPRLAELRYGDWEGFTWAEIEVDNPNALATWRADPEGFCPPGGETHYDLRRRSAEALAEIIASGTRTVVVSHGVSGAVMRGLNLGLDARAMFVLEKPQDAFFRLLDGREERILAALETFPAVS
ncbi:MAG: histidine phosphatase family protein [Reyranella sp.]|uniref:histidine phosphatase family protein n=1 Tax=Reyranella sp. TaxID=1929291 RepID=UPI001AC5CF35|nr:histidine phosphatase family protein [Reyranella sp.]MBN9090463.1 histidine phosphatase family protein [Reyranella sp.]